VTFGSDLDRAGYLAAEHLISLGHERIGLILGPPDHVPSRRKLAAFEAVRGDRLAWRWWLAAAAAVIVACQLAFVVPEPKQYADFYSRVLGFRVSDWIEDWFVFMRCGPDHHTINFVRGKRTQMHHVAFELKDWPQVQAACDFLVSQNITIIWGPGRHGPGHNIYTYHRNPDYQIIEMFTELDKMMDESLGYFDPRPWHRDRPRGRPSAAGHPDREAAAPRRSPDRRRS